MTTLRPNSAANNRTLRSRRSTMGMRSLTDAVSQNTSKAKSKTSSELVKDLENDIRKVVEEKRADCDKLQFQLVKKREEVEKAKLVLQDLTNDSVALGVDKYPDANERLQPVNSVSRRKVYSKHTKIHELEEKLENKAKETLDLARKSLTYEHLWKRLAAEKIEIVHTNNSLKKQLTEQQHKMQELVRVEIAAGEALSQTQTRLIELKSKIQSDIRMWELEMAQREKWNRERCKFEKYYAKQLEAIEKPEKKESDGDSLGLHVRFAAKKVANKHFNRKFEKRFEENEIAEERYEQAFRSIGAKVENLEAEEIIRVYEVHEQLQEELVLKQTQEQDMIEDLTKKIEKLKENIQQSVVGPLRTNERQLEEKHSSVAKIEKELAFAREEFQNVQNMVQPAKVGIQQIVLRVLNQRHGMETAAEVNDAIESVERELLRILAETVKLDESRSAGQKSSSTENMKLLLKAASTDVLSPFNIRIQPGKSNADEKLSDCHNSPSPSNYSKPKNVKKSLLLSDPESDANDDGEVMDRKMVKKISSSVYLMSSSKSRRPGSPPGNSDGEYLILS